MASAVVSPDASSPSFKSSDEAADAVSKTFSNTPDSERAAVTFQRPDGSHVFSTVTTHSHENFEMKAQMPKGWKISGIVHSHPGQDDAGQLFSPQDLAAAKQVGTPSYIRFLKDDSIRRYTPGKTQTQLYSPNGEGHTLTGIRVSKGDPLDAPASDAASALAAPASAPTVDPAPTPLAAPVTGGLLSQAAQTTP